MDGILQLETLSIAFLEERLSRCRGFADGGGLPWEIGAGRINLETRPY
jgi:hypothetical protein